MIVTPGYLVADGELVTAAKLRSVAQPTVELEAGDADASVLDVPGVRTAMGFARYNYLDNPVFAENRWDRGTTPVSCAAGSRTFRADEWWCRPSGAAVTYERVEDGPDDLTLFAAKLTGAASVTTVEFGQDIQRTIASALAGPLVLSFWIYNNTGAGLTPTVLVNTPNAADNFSAVTLRATQAMSESAAAATWKQYTVALDCTGMTNISNGLQVVIRTPSGAMSSSGKSVEFARLKLELAPDGEATSCAVEREPSETSAGTGTINNLLVNGQLERFLSPAVVQTCAAGVDSYNAERVFVQPAGASVTAERSTAVPANNLTGQSLKVTGASGANAVAVGTNLEPREAAKVRRAVVWSAWVRYTDGVGSATVTPTLVLKTPPGESEWASATAQVTATLDPCAHNTWTRLTYAFDGSALTDIANGLRWELTWPSGSLDASGKYVEIAELLLEAGTSASDFEAYREAPPDSSAVGSASGLLVVGSAATGTVTADELVVRNVDGRPLTLTAVSAVATISASGANGFDSGSASTGWVYLWVISNGTSVAALWSASATAPVLPTGYDYRALIGPAYFDGAALRVYRQAGRRILQAKVAAYTGTVATSYTSQSLATAVPPEAKTVFGQAGATDSAPTRLALSATSLGAVFEQVLMLADTTALAFVNFKSCGNWELPLATAQTLWMKSALATVNYRVEVHGYTF